MTTHSAAPDRPSHQAHLTHPKYRADIDGLRAIAVLSVVAYHAFPGWLPGGFVGVDVFFVISGFLISTILFQNFKSNSFSFIEFYSRRIKRIFPALLLVLTFSSTLGWFILDSAEFKQLGKHIAGGAGFVSNFVLWTEHGYFDNLSDTKPLLHLWSLGIEEQFYIVWPLLLWLAWKIRVKLLMIALTLGLLSFALNLAAVHSAPSAAFYLPLTRFWELLAGSVLAYATLADKNSIARYLGRTTVGHLSSLLGSGLLLAGFWMISRERSFPGWWAVLPTLGAILIIAAGTHAWINRVILSNRVLVWFGLISFPLYLWHWPLLSFARIIESGTPARQTRLLAILIAIALAWLTYRLLENPIRLGPRSKITVVLLLAFMGLVGLVGYNTYQRDGLTFRATAQILALKNSGEAGGDEGLSINQCGITNAADNIFQNCKQDRRAQPKYALLGDSKAGALYGGLVRTSTDAGRWLFIGGTSLTGAPVPVLSSDKIFERHQKHIVIATDAIIKNKSIQTVVLAAGARNLFNLKQIDDLPASPNYQAALHALGNTIDKILKAGKKVVIVVDNPTLPDPKDCIGRTTSSEFLRHLFPAQTKANCRLDLRHHQTLTAPYTQLLLELERTYHGQVRVFDATAQLCELENNVCLPYKNGRLLYGFTDHISDYAAGLIGRDLNAFLTAD